MRQHAYIKHTQGHILPLRLSVQKSLIDDIINALDGFDVTMFTYSTKWKNWIAILDLKTCLDCRRLHGKVFRTEEIIYKEPPLHDRCRCEVKQLKAIYNGYRTRHRILYSNDGLVFVTYDHYETFIEIV